jgi:hypothetical protein
MLLCHGTWYSMQSCAMKWKFVFLTEVSVAMRNFIVISWVMKPCTCGLVDGYLLIRKPLARLHDR